MVTEWELWAAANEVVRQHGGEAATFAAARQVVLAEAGDAVGARAWLQIGKCIVELQRDRPWPGEKVQ